MEVSAFGKMFVLFFTYIMDSANHKYKMEKCLLNSGRVKI
jgi:hypothetical protein